MYHDDRSIEMSARCATGNLCRTSPKCAPTSPEVDMPTAAGLLRRLVQQQVARRRHGCAVSDLDSCHRLRCSEDRLGDSAVCPARRPPGSSTRSAPSWDWFLTTDSDNCSRSATASGGTCGPISVQQPLRSAEPPRINFIHFTHGAEDPWRMVSIRNDLNTEALLDVIPNELAGSDLGAISEDDSEELQEVKRRLKALMSYYLFPAGPRKMAKDELTAGEL
ncbi:hypothetical protein pipiens_006412 [Culex pipiens pipiens]|uniref:Uncharacterized protein n=1 Tax=Culex pipiens pipiens TaxID=38569 RepID=A0ABD1DQ41_CULPP